MRAQDIPSTKQSFKLLSVNNRPLNLSLKLGKLVSAKINESYSENMLLAPSVWFVSMSIPLDKVDVNIEPSKCDMILCNEEHLIKKFKEHLSQVIANEHVTEVETVNKANTFEKVVNFQVPPLLTKEGADNVTYEVCPVNLQLEEDTATDKTTIVQLSNEFENILESNDDSLVQELDSTIKHIKNRYYSENNGDNAVIDSVRIEPTNETLFVPEVDETVDNGNDFSSTVYDSTRFSSEMDIADDILTIPRKCTETINPSILSFSEPVNAEILEEDGSSKPETAADDSVSGTLTEINFSTDEAPLITFPTKKRKNDSIDKNNATKQNTLKQMAVSSYLTYHLSSSKKRALVVSEPKAPRIGELSQDTFGEKVYVAFQLTLEMKKRHRHLVDDERWVKRSGIPSTNLVLGAVELYEKISHKSTDKLPKLDESGIYQIK
ncbi:hypothetical protein PMKS-001444 [Pichia membranifaciens]|uniref:DNA mismatch repair protein S5 domain-containing protein n=1 Tax=Pichia membranifaciens TaxID=4926 RepID=A0A1Q2YEI9_9ASCO|nr:hypothetical protein PMKS-001444 [Pichia membranifaciens]